jgi:hypothetical protein
MMATALFAVSNDGWTLQGFYQNEGLSCIPVSAAKV